MRNRLSIIQEVFSTGMNRIQREPFWLVEHVETIDGVRSRISSQSFSTLEQAKAVLKKNGYEIS